jgi:hypothetical protein
MTIHKRLLPATPELPPEPKPHSAPRRKRLEHASKTATV